MSSNEDYLDNLLKSVTNEEAEAVSEETEIGEDPTVADDPVSKEEPMVADDPVSKEEPMVADDSASEEDQTVESDLILEDAPSVVMSEDEISRMFQEAEMAAKTEELTIKTEQLAETLEVKTDLYEPVPEGELEIADGNEEDSLTVEKALSMSESEIERLLAESTKEEADDQGQEPDEQITEVLVDSVEEIGELLEMSDRNEAVDSSVLEDLTDALGDRLEDSEEESSTKSTDSQDEPFDLFAAMDEEAESEDEEPKNKKGKKEKKRKQRKEQVIKAEPEDGLDGEKKENKPSFFAKLLSLFTDEDEEEVPQKPVTNDDILSEMENEDTEGYGQVSTKGKKEKAQKKEKPKKEKKAKKEKPKKEKPKKEKKPVEEVAPTKKIARKSIIIVFGFAISLMAAILIINIFLGDHLQGMNARKAYNDQDYESVYAQLYGTNLSTDEEIMLKHAKTVMRIQRRLAVYEQYLAMDMELEALNSLMQTIGEYNEIYTAATTCNATVEVSDYYQQILTILQVNYGLTEQDAMLIARVEDNVEYTRYLTGLVGGDTNMSFSEEYGEDGTLSEGDIDQEIDNLIQLPDNEMLDILPEEEEMTTPNFAD